MNAPGRVSKAIRSEPLRQGLGGAVLAALTAGLWWIWLGRDTSYYYDETSRSWQGPYTPMQVAGCVLSLIALGAVAALVLRPWLVSVVLTLAFTISWSAQAASHDETGLWGVGAMLIFWGMGVGSLVVTYGVWLLRRLVVRGRRTG
jgi:hypothetical protein